jgi:non-canonical poly(A) RNA polymerase PAPD5/7
MIDPRLDEFSAAVRIDRSTQPSRMCPWCSGISYVHDDVMLCLHRELLDFARWISPTSEEEHLRLLVVHRFRNAIIALWPQAMPICHGSSATSTYLPVGDIDLAVHLPGAPSNVGGLLVDLCVHLDSLKLFRQCEVIGHARIPIVKGIEHPFGFRIDISINNENGVLNIERNHRLMSVYPAFLPLFLFAKFFLFENRLDEPFHGGLGSNTLQNLIIYIIQASDNQLHLGHLLEHFFRTFGKKFNYIVAGVSVRAGGRLFSRINTKRINWREPCCLSVEDPQIPGQFLGENFFRCLEFRERCKEALEHIITAKRRRSVLVKIVQMSATIIQRRQEMARLYAALVSGAVSEIDPAEKGHRQPEMPALRKSTGHLQMPGFDAP